MPTTRRAYMYMIRGLHLHGTRAYNFFITRHRWSNTTTQMHQYFLRRKQCEAGLNIDYRSAKAHELALMFLLLGAVGVHCLPHVLLTAGFSDTAVNGMMGNFRTHAGLSLTLLGLPGVSAAFISNSAAFCWKRSVTTCNTDNYLLVTLPRVEFSNDCFLRKYFLKDDF
jgi:hypothetical protein